MAVSISTRAYEKFLAAREKQINALQAELAQLREQFGIHDGTSSIPCARCNGPVVEFVIPSDIWNAVIRPDGRERDDEHICYDCWLAAIGKFSEQSAREHEAWEAMRNGTILALSLTSGIQMPTFIAHSHLDVMRYYANDPVNAVLLVVQAAKQETETP